MLGYFLATLVGLSLGLLGGGGSILTVPILVYILKMDPKTSIALSLAIVGLTSLVGFFSHYKNKNVDFKAALIFAPLAMIGTFLGARLSQLISAEFQLLLFAIIMLIASVQMFKNKKERHTQTLQSPRYLIIFVQAFIVGIITGVVGVGGGFLIVPALVLLAGLSMKKSIGTSLFVISLNSLTGFIGYIGIVEIPWTFLLGFTAFSILGILIGSKLTQFVSQSTLRKVFAFFLVIMGVFILYKNSSLLF